MSFCFKDFTDSRNFHNLIEMIEYKIEKLELEFGK